MTCLRYNVLVLQGETRRESLLRIERLERFSIECHRTKTKPLKKDASQPIANRSKAKTKTKVIT